MGDAQRAGPGPPRFHGRLRRPGALQHDPDEDVRRLPEGHAGGAQRALRRARARHGRHLQRYDPPRLGHHPPCATFFIFSDYMRAAIRLSALSEVGVLYVMTHDSIGLGEDGPTHQPVEHLASFRAMPNIYPFRPCDGNETAGAYAVAVESRKTPSLFALSRQGLPNQAGSSAANAKKGGYVIYGEAAGAPDCILIGTGSEVEICIEAAKALEGEGKKVRVVSMPCAELFDAQSAEYKESILPAACSVRVSCEAGSTFGWGKYVGNTGASVGVDDFGASAPANILYEKYGITADAVVQAAKGQM